MKSNLKLTLAFFLFTACFFIPMNIDAKDDNNETVTANTVNTVPDEMEAKTVITFITDNQFIIDKGGIARNKTEISISPEIEQKILQAKKDGTYYTAYHAESIKPIKGLKVYYADDGFILKLKYPEGTKNPILQKVISPNENLKAPKEGPGPNDTLLYKWGAHQNQIWKLGNSKTARLGAGRATTFNDRTGEMDNTLVKGDAATSQAYDNCAYNTSLNVIAQTKNGSYAAHSLRKRDNGGMPDAVLDIWKTGVEYWGYTWNEYLSINSVQYTHG